MVLYIREDDDIDRGLIGFWKLDDLKVKGVTKAIDRIGFNDGDYAGGTIGTDHHGISNEAFYLDGDDRVDCNNVLKLRNNFSITCWAKIDNYTTANQNPVDKLVATGYRIVISDKLSFAWRNDDATYRSVSTVASMKEFDGLWVHQAITFLNGKAKIYVNGIYNNEITYADELVKIGDDILYFGYSANNVVYLIGALRNIRFYKRVLTDGEIKKLYRLRV